MIAPAKFASSALGPKAISATTPAFPFSYANTVFAKPNPNAFAFSGLAINIPGVPAPSTKLDVPYTSTVPLKVNVPFSSSCAVAMKLTANKAVKIIFFIIFNVS